MRWRKERDALGWSERSWTAKEAVKGTGDFLLEGDAAVVEIRGGGVGGMAAWQQERAEREVKQGLVLVQQHEQKIA